MSRQRDAAAIVKEMADELASSVHRHFLEESARLKAMTESPIEAVFIAALLLENEIPGGLIGMFDLKLFISGSGDPSRVPDFDGLHVYPQAQVGRHRLDFLFIHQHSWFRNDRWERRVLRVAIECDGHDFHEKTKEQAARDKKRDRDLALAGITILRFTGSEIWRQPRKCIEELMDLLAKRQWGTDGEAD